MTGRATGRISLFALVSRFGDLHCTCTCLFPSPHFARSTNEKTKSPFLTEFIAAACPLASTPFPRDPASRIPCPIVKLHNSPRPARSSLRRVGEGFPLSRRVAPNLRRQLQRARTGAPDPTNHSRKARSLDGTAKAGEHRSELGLAERTVPGPQVREGEACQLARGVGEEDVKKGARG